jgi:hypothetical protein
MMRVGVLLLLVAACSSEHPPPTANIKQPVLVCFSSDASLPPQRADLDAGPDADPTYAPFMSGACPAPPSTCVDSDWTAYFDQGRCVQDRCVWEVKLFRCTNGCAADMYGAVCKADQGGSTAPPPPRN